jgi:phage terminase large subunit-like protein
MTTATINLDLQRIARLIPGYDPFATSGDDCWFDAEAAQLAIDFFPECLQHIEGSLAGKPFILEPWQQAIVANLFGWKRKDAKGRTVRRYREALIFVPRKNGKTPLCAGIGLYCLFCDPERGQQNYIAASTKEQAGLLFRHCKGMVEQDETLAAGCRVFGGNAPAGQSQSIVRNVDTSFLKIISGDVSVGKHGKNLNVAVVDELHEQPGRDLVDTLRTSMASANKPQPLMIYATTSDYEREGSICNETHDYACKVRDGVIEDARFLPVIYEASKDDDWTIRETWAKANPNLGVSVSEEYLVDECKKAQDNPALENLFKRLHLDLRTEQCSRMIPMDQWDACGEPFDVEILRGRRCYGGLDLATVNDLAALVLVFPPDEEAEPYYCLAFFWCPRDGAEKRERSHKVPYLAWAKAGHIELTADNSIDYRAIRKRVNELAKDYDIQEIPFDPYNATHLATELGEEDGQKMVEFRQGMLSMNEPCKLLLRLLLDGKLRHGGNPVLRWMANNAAGKTDPAGNMKPDKEHSGDKIDGIVALIMGLGRAMVAPQPASAEVFAVDW